MIFTFQGGGAREKVFWQNYFFHCAYTRYEAGLSIDEIWSYNPDSEGQEGAAQESSSQQQVAQAEAEETVVFDPKSEMEPAGSETTFPAESTLTPEAGGESGTGLDVTDYSAGKISNGAESFGNDFEVVDDEYAVDKGTGDAELDELEAEIARELED